MTENAKPVYRLRYGNVVAAVWLNNSSSGYFYNTTFCRLYKDGDQWGDSSSFEDRDLPNLAKAATDALLRGAPGGYVEARVVREYLTKLDALPGPLASIDAGALLSAYEQERVTRTALDVAIAAAEGR